MKTLIKRVIPISLGIFLSASAWADISAVTADCEGCHGDGGVSQWTDVPTIAGLPEFTHADALYFFRDEARPCSEVNYKQGDTSKAASMCSVAGGLSDDQIDELAAYYAEMDFVAATQDFDAALAATGKAVHEAKCEKCHSDGGTNADDEASILGGQQMGYLKATFAEYMSGEREQDKSMEAAMSSLSEDDVKALLNYYASLQ